MLEPKNECSDTPGCDCHAGKEMLPMAPAGTGETAEVACRGGALGKRADPMERPGYVLRSFVEAFVRTPAGPVPRVRTTLDRSDRMGVLAARLGFGRNDYRVAPGLYCVGNPTPDSPVLVTANYKLTFDALRRALANTSAWILVADTRGINVWCAAGDALFSSEEVSRRAASSRLADVVNHRRLVLPQLAATGVSAKAVKKGCGFSVVWGPVRVEDIEPFLSAGMNTEPAMRRVTFSLKERLVLVPVEITLLWKGLLIGLAAIFLISGIGSHIFSLSMAWSRGGMAAAAGLAGIVAGTVLTPALLPWIPSRPFAVKGLILGALAWAILALLFQGKAGGLEMTALLLFTIAVSSYLAVNFTGSTPFTSPSGVEKEMRIAIPFQAAATLLAIVAWVGAGFIG